MKFVLAIVFASATLLSAVGLVASGGWLISAATLMPPILTLQVAIVGVRFFGISRGVARYVERVISHDAALSGIAKLRFNLWNSVSDLGPRGIWRLKSSDSLDRLTSDTDTLQDKVTRVQVPFVAAWISALILVVLQTIWLWWAGILLALVFIVAGFIVPLVSLFIERKIARETLEIRNDLTNHILRLIKSGSLLSMLGAIPKDIVKLHTLENSRYRVESKASWSSFFTQVASGFVTGVVVVMTAMVAADNYLDGTLDGKMIAVLVLLPLASTEIINTFSQVAVSYTRVKEAEQRVLALLAPQSTIKKSHQDIEIGTIKVTDLTVTWDHVPTLKKISFDIERGQSIAIVGESGSGKSTLATALLGLIEYEGSITISGVEIASIENTSDYITALTQETYIFNTTVAENLKIANATATNEQLLSILNSVGLRHLASSEDELQNVIGGPHRKLSGGETQRIGIARILLSDSPYVILDEPTAHLDDVTKESIWNLIQDVMKSKTLIVITHDMKLIPDVTKVIYLQNGEIGKHHAQKQ